MENVNQEKRQKFMENAGKRVNNVLHNIQILEPMARSNNYDYCKEDVEQMFTAIRGQVDKVEKSFMKKFEEKEQATKSRAVFSFGEMNTSKENEDFTEDEKNEEEIVNNECN